MRGWWHTVVPAPRVSGPGLSPITQAPALEPLTLKEPSFLQWETAEETRVQRLGCSETRQLP